MKWSSFRRAWNRLETRRPGGTAAPSGHRVVVVGNGPSVLDHTLGDAIEASDVIVRCNNGAVDGFESHVGRRTDVLFFCDTRAAEQHVAEHAPDEAELVMYLVHRKQEEIDERIHRRGCQFVIGSVAREIAARHGLRRRLTTGMMAICHCLERFPDSDVCLHGFDYVERRFRRRQTHYWHAKVARNLHTVHSVKDEARLLRRWMRQGKLYLLTDYVRRHAAAAPSIH